MMDFGRLAVFAKAHVSAYTRKDGTHVADHDRHAQYAAMFKPSLGIKRENMPQIPNGIKPKFLDELRSSGVCCDHATMDPKALKPTQGDYNPENMDYLTAEARAGRFDENNPVLVSSDGRVLDGHHRWAVAALEGLDLPAIKVGLPMSKLLQVAEEFNKKNGIERRGTTGLDVRAPAMAKSSGPILLLLKGHVGAYLRGGKLVNLEGYQGRQARPKPAQPGQADLFGGHDAVTMPRDEAVAEHKRLVAVLRSPSREDDKAEAKKQAAELAEYQKKPHPLERAAARIKEMRDHVAAGGEHAGFYEAILPDHQREHDRLASAFAAYNKHGDGTELSTEDGKRHAMLLPDATNPGKYRYQMFDARGFSAHSTHNTPEEAVADAASQGFTVHNPGILDKLSGTEEWDHGMAISAIMQAHNSGQIDWKTATDRMKALHDAREARKNEVPESSRKLLFGMNGAQIQAMQGGKLKGADDFDGSGPDDKVWSDARAKAVAERKASEASALDQAKAADPRIAALHAAGVPAAHLLNAHRELKGGDDSLIRDLGRIHGVAMPDVAPPDPNPDHPAPVPRTMLADVPEERRAEWLDLHRRQHEMHHYDLGRLREQMDRSRTKVHASLRAMREMQAGAKQFRDGGLPGSEDRAREFDDAAAARRAEFDKHSEELGRLKNMHQTIYERVAKLGREKDKILPMSGELDIDWAAQRKRTSEEQQKHEKAMLKMYRAHYKEADKARKKMMLVKRGKT